MRRTYDVPFGRAGLAGLLVALTLLCLPGTSIAGGSESSPALATGAGLLQHGDGYGSVGGAPPVRDVQRTLRRLGWQPGPVDGFYGPRTQAAVTRFQAASGLTPDGIVGPGTRQALNNAQDEPLRRGAGFAQPGGSRQVRELQADLRRRGLDPGPVDGLFGPQTQAAVERLQRRNDVPVSGVATATTRRVLATGGDATGGDPAERTSNEPAQPTTGGSEPAQPTTGGTEPAQPDTGEGEPATGEPATGTPVQASADTGDSGGVSLPMAIAIGLAALLAGLVGGTLLGRRDRVVSGTAVPLAEGVTAEGESRSPTVGRFRGNVHALVLGRRGLRRTPEARYLVSDPAKEDPFWVSQEEVSSIVPPARARHPAARESTELGQVRALGYVSTAASAGLRSDEFGEQLNAIDAYCDERGWELVEVVQDVDTARARERQGLLYALEKIGRGEASCIIVAELGRLSRSAADLGGILERLERSDGRLVALDVGLDTASDEGRVAAQALASVGSWEHERTAGRLAAAAAPPPAVLDPLPVEDVGALKQRIVDMRESGMTLQAIADVLNAEGVPTLRGGAKWRPSSVQSAAGYRRPPKPQRE
jgi:peptidoglycan hydrolase-like protein with peptidoglycan-binding domain/DNA invertase Pin-like site-specific DNA recombinase